MKQSFLVKGLAALTIVGSLAVSALPMSADAAVKKIKRPIVRKYRVSVSAIKGKDEKNFSDPTTRCLTPAMVTLHNKALKQMEADIEKAGSGHEAAIQKYRENLDIIWSAMSEPYCGYGSQGVTAVKSSFQKSVARTRDQFLASIKK